MRKALRNKMLINKSWFLTRKHPTMTKDSIVTKIQDFVFQHCNVSGFILRLKVFRMKKLRTSDEVFQFKFYPRNSAESTEKIFSDYSRKSLSILSLHRRCSKVLWRKQAESWVQQKCTSMRCPWSVSPVREPPRIKTSRQQTVVATTISPQMLIIIVATNPGRTISESQNSENGAAWKFLEVLGIMVIFPNRPVTFPELSLRHFNQKKFCCYHIDQEQGEQNEKETARPRGSVEYVLAYVKACYITSPRM